jgi:aspartate/methionine/tyrosine aminotransferase
MKFSPLLSQVPDYPFRKVGKISREVEQRDGVRVINARIGIPDVEAPHSVKKALAKYVLADKSTFGYPCDVHPERGIPELIEAIIEDYRVKHAVKLRPENIMVTSWAKEVLYDMAYLFEPGTIYIPDPVYPVYEAATALSGHQSRRVVTSAATGWLPEFNFSNKSEKPVAFYFCDPNNPTGAVASRDYYLSLLKQMKAADVTGIFDKAYKDYVFDTLTKPLSITQIPGMMEHGYEIVSLSKHYNFVGIGLAWVVSSEENINRWLKANSQHRQGVEWFKQKAGAAALTDPSVKAEMQDYFKELKERCDLFVKGLRGLGLKVEIPRATPYLWIQVPDSLDDEDFVLNTLINKAHVALMPGSYFGENGKGYMRATLFLSRSEIEEALERIQKVKSW